MTQLSILDGEHLKQHGLDAIEQTDRAFVTRMRTVAKEIALESGHVSVDNLRVFADSLGWVPVHPNSWGGIFRGPHWREVGRQKSALPSNHRREIRVWEYRPRPHGAQGGGRDCETNLS